MRTNNIATAKVDMLLLEAGGVGIDVVGLSEDLQPCTLVLN
jgi:hypothetical protein